MKRKQSNVLLPSKGSDSILKYFKRLREAYEKKAQDSEIPAKKAKIEDEANIIENKPNDSILTTLNPTSVDFPPFTLDKKNLSFETLEPDFNKEKGSRVYHLQVIDSYLKDRKIQLRLVDTVRNINYETSVVGYHFKIIKGTNVAIIGNHDSNKFFDLSNHSDNLIILHPRKLVNITSLSTAVSCIRMAFLSDLYGGTFVPSLPMLLGSLGHFLIESIISTSITKSSLTPPGAPTPDYLKQLALCFLESSNTAQLLYSANLTADEIMDKLNDYIQPIIDLCNSILYPEEKTSKPIIIDNCKIKMSVTSLEDYIEDHVYGLRGKIDMICRIEEVQPLNPSVVPSIKVGDILPIEVKTGKFYLRGNIQHRAQVMAYSLVLENKYKTEVKNSLLLYLKNGARFVLVKMSKFDKKAIFQVRNRLAFLLNKMPSRPLDFAETPDPCKFCYVSNICNLHATINDIPHPHAKAIPTLDLDIEDIEFYKNWNKEMLYETLSSLDSKKLPDGGKIIPPDTDVMGPLILEKQIHNKTSWILYFSLPGCTLEKDKPFPTSRGSNLVPGTSVSGTLIEESQVRTSAFMGFIHESDAKNGCFSVKVENPLSDILLGRCFELSILITNSISFLPLTFLAKTFVGNSGGEKKLRDLIVKYKPPSFASDEPNDFDLSQEKKVSEIFGDSISDLQIKAISHCLRAEDYALLWGLPGTGKTTTISALLYILNLQKKKVLIVSHTNAAVDNILLKLLKVNVPFLRVGKQASVHQLLKEHTLEHLISHKDRWTTTDLSSLLEEYNIFATTCVGIRNNLFEKLKYFDVCIVDEATQVHLPLLLGSLLLAKTFILAGDHYQMAPLILNKKTDIIKKSLFEMFLPNNPESVIALDRQFRMHPSISELSSKLFYRGLLKPSDTVLSVLSKKLTLPHWNDSILDKRDWMKDVLHPLNSHPVVFIDYSSLTDYLSIALPTSRVANNREAFITKDFIRTLVDCGVPQGSIGILTTYSFQAELIEAMITMEYPSVEVHTIDRFQGRDKDVIILSLVTNDELSESCLINDDKRLNVALTRSKKKLIILGRYKYLERLGTFSQLLNILDERGAIFKF